MKLTYPALLSANELIRKISDTTYWLCITRTVQQSKLFPVPSYMLLSYLQAFYTWPHLLRKAEAVMPAEAFGDRAREVSLKLNTVNTTWCLPAFYLLGRELLLGLGLLKAEDACEDVAYLCDFTRRFNLAYHRNDAHLTNKDFGDRSQLLPERTLQVFEADLFEVRDGDRLHTAATQLLSQLAQYAFLAHCECRIGIHNSGPYQFGERNGDKRQLLVRDFTDLSEGDYPWLDGIATDLPANNLTIPVVVKNTHFRLVDDWASFESEPAYASANVVAVGLYTSDALTEGYQPIGMGSAEELAETMTRYRDILHAATAKLWTRIAGWSREKMIDAGALVYASVPKDFAHLAGVYDPADWFTLDPRAARFKPLLNDEYGRDSLGELVGYLSYPTQAASDYVMARTSDGPRHMMSGVPYSVLRGGDFAPSTGPAQHGTSSLNLKTGGYTTSRGRLDLASYNQLARAFTPAIQSDALRWLDEEWVKHHHHEPLADELYRQSQRASRHLRGRGAGLRRADLRALDEET